MKFKIIIYSGTFNGDRPALLASKILYFYTRGLCPALRDCALAGLGLIICQINGLTRHYSMSG